jgi:2-dehydropantoate 2-reductase
MSILVVGAGATGGFFGLRLAKDGRDVTFLVRPRRAEMLGERGLRLVGPDEEESIEPNLITADALDREFDVVLLSVKATVVEAAIEDFAPAVGARTRVVPFLNGIGHLAALNERFSAERVLGGVVKVQTQLDADGDIQVLGPLSSLEIGTQDGGASERLDEVAAELGGAAGFEFSVSDDIVAAMWHKWVFIATIGALTCLMRANVGEIVAQPGGETLGPALAAEAAAVSAAAGYPVPGPELEWITTMSSTPGSPLTSSLYRDMDAGSATEVEPILGDLVAEARRLEVDTPLLDLATLHLRIYEERRAA